MAPTVPELIDETRQQIKAAQPDGPFKDGFDAIHFAHQMMAINESMLTKLDAMEEAFHKVIRAERANVTDEPSTSPELS